MCGEKLKNILVINDYAYINGGAAKIAIKSAIGLSKYPYHVHFFAAVGPVDEELQNSKASVTCLGLDDINNGSRLTAMKAGIWNKKAETAFNRLLDMYPAEETIIHIHGWTKALSSSVIWTAKRRHYRIVLTLHDYFTICPNGGLYDYQSQIICRNRPMSLRCILCNCDKRNYAQKGWRVLRQTVQDRVIRNNTEIVFISISQKNEELIRPFVKATKFYRVNNFVETSKYQNTDCTRTRRFLYLGRLSEEKGIDLFCRAITELKTQYDVEGMVVGNGALYETMAEAYPEVLFAGWKTNDEIQALLSEARAMILPSRWYEGAPVTVLEAMSVGTPCIVSDCTSATELIQDGVNGFCAKAGDVESIKGKIKAALDDALMRKVQQATKDSFDENTYSEKTHIEKLLSVYRECI